ncbi:hypothetical protein MRX96_024094 [Rhipicephalus microplus]
MSQLTAKKRRKLYLGPDIEFVVPRSTRWYSQQSTSSASATATTRLAGVLNSPPDSSQASQTSPGDRCLTDGCSVYTSSIGVRTEVPEGSDDFFNSAHGVGDNAYQSPEECPDNESNHSENDSEDGDTRPFRDTDQDPSSGTEEDSGDYLCGDGASVNRDQNPGAEGDISGDRSSVPSFDESELLARCVADFGTKKTSGISNHNCSRYRSNNVVHSGSRPFLVCCGRLVETCGSLVRFRKVRPAAVEIPTEEIVVREMRFRQQIPLLL